MEALIGVILLVLFIWLFNDCLMCRRNNKAVIERYFEPQDKVVNKAVREILKDVLELDSKGSTSADLFCVQLEFDPHIGIQLWYILDDIGFIVRKSGLSNYNIWLHWDKATIEELKLRGYV